MAELRLLDSSLWIRLWRRRRFERLRQRVDELGSAGLLATCDMIVLEILRGAASEQEFQRSQVYLGGLRQLSTGSREWAEAARLGYRLRGKGVAVTGGDLLIAAVAISHGATLLHADNDFERIREHGGLRTEPVFDLLDG